MSKIRTGQLAVTGSEQQICPTPFETSVYRIKALSTNAAPVYLGQSGVTTTTGHALEPGEELTYGFQADAGEAIFDVPITDWHAVGSVSDRLTWLVHLA